MQPHHHTSIHPRNHPHIDHCCKETGMDRYLEKHKWKIISYQYNLHIPLTYSAFPNSIFKYPKIRPHIDHCCKGIGMDRYLETKNEKLWVYLSVPQHYLNIQPHHDTPIHPKISPDIHHCSWGTEMDIYLERNTIWFVTNTPGHTLTKKCEFNAKN